jgi:hypothetical protein
MVISRGSPDRSMVSTTSRAGLAEEPLDRLLDRLALRRLTVDRDDLVARHDARAERGRVVHRGDDREHAVDLVHLGADADILAGELLLELVAERRGDVGRVRVVERLEHAVDRARLELVEIGLLDREGVDDVLDLDQRVEEPVPVAPLRDRERRAHHRDAQDEQQRPARPRSIRSVSAVP